MPQFVRDVEELRKRAINKIEEGPVTSAYKGDKDRTIAILNEALATEIVCVLRYLHHYFMATGVHGTSVAGEFKEHADAEREHADALAERIQQLGGKPDFNPKNLLERSVSQYVEGETLADMIRFFADNDPTTRVLLEGLLKDEEEHANDLADLLYVVDPSSGQTEGQDPGTRPLQIERERRPGEERRQRQDRRREQSTESSAGRSSAEPPVHEPGGTGRPQRVRPVQRDEVGADELGETPQSGASRAVRITKPNRKKRVA